VTPPTARYRFGGGPNMRPTSRASRSNAPVARRRGSERSRHGTGRMIRPSRSRAGTATPFRLALPLGPVAGVLRRSSSPEPPAYEVAVAFEGPADGGPAMRSAIRSEMSRARSLSMCSGEARISRDEASRSKFGVDLRSEATVAAASRQTQHVPARPRACSRTSCPASLKLSTVIVPSARS